MSYEMLQLDTALPPDVDPETDDGRIALAKYRGQVAATLAETTGGERPAWKAAMVQVAVYLPSDSPSYRQVHLQAVWDAAVEAGVLDAKANIMALPLEQRKPREGAITDGSLLVRIWPREPDEPPPFYRAFAMQVVSIAGWPFAIGEKGWRLAMENAAHAIEAIYPAAVWPADTVEPGGLFAWAIREAIDTMVDQADNAGVARLDAGQDTDASADAPPKETPDGNDSAADA